MKNSKNDFGIAGQSTTEVKKSHKHDANLQKNSSLYFQIGLILCLLGTYALFEMQFQETKFNFVEEKAEAEPITIDYVEPFTVEVVKLKDPNPLPTKELNDVYTEVEDDVPVVETLIKTPDEPKVTDKPVADIGDIVEPDVDELDKGAIVVDFTKIEKVPVYPGCERKKTNAERKKCMSDKVTKLINKKFNTGIGSEYGLSGKQRIHSEFTIDKNGEITDIQIIGPHKALEREAKRVINKIPKMQPGLQRQVPVGVKYTLPIVFQVQN